MMTKSPVFVEVFLKREWPAASRSFDELAPMPIITMRVAQSGYYRGITGHWVDIKLGPHVRLSEVRAYRLAGAIQIKNHIDNLNATDAWSEFIKNSHVWKRRNAT